MNRFSLILLLILAACQSPSQYQKVDDFLSSINPDINLKDYKSVVVINERGSCIHCNAAFNTAISKYIDRTEVLFVISSSGNHIDISPYLQNKYSNIVLDYANNFYKLGLVNQCAILILEHQRIDTIIDIKLDNIQMSYDFFKTTLVEN